MSEQRSSSTTSAGTPAAPPVVATANNIRPSSSIPQVQVIPQPLHSPPYMSQFSYNQQQLMLQNAAVQAAMQANMNQLNMAATIQGRPPSVSPTSPGLLSPTATSQVLRLPWNTDHTGLVTVSSAAGSMTAATVAPSNAKGTNGNKGQGQQSQGQGQAATMVGGKQPATVMPAQTPLVLGPAIGVLPGQAAAGNHAFVTQGSKGQTVTVAHQGQSQLINTQAPLRLTSQPQLVTNTGQFITSQPMLTNQAVLQAMANLGQLPLAAHQPLLANHPQSPAILAGHSLYIRPIQQGMMPSNMQNTAAMKSGKMEMPQNLQKSSTTSATGKTSGSGQTGKTLLPSTSKSATMAKIHPTNLSGQGGNGAKLNIPTVIPKQASKGRSKTQSKSSSSSVPSTPTSVQKPPIPATSKPATPTLPAAAVAPPVKSQSDSEVETGKKTTPVTDIAPKDKTASAALKSVGKKDGEAKAVENVPQEKTETAKVTEVPMEVSEEKTSSPPPELLPTVVEKQKAIVKPHILTHIIEGFVIQEGPEPFPVQHSSLLTEFIPPKPSRTDKESDEDANDAFNDQPPPLLSQSEAHTGSLEPETIKCEFCGKTELAVRFRRSKRFCSVACAKRYNVACSSRVGLFKSKSTGKYVRKKKNVLGVRKGWRSGRGGRLSYNISTRLPGEEMSSSNSGQESSSSMSPTPTPEFDTEMEGPRSNPAKWTVSEVYEFIRSLPGCGLYADEFRSQEIDGQALLLLKEDHLMTAMNIKLGPALKICARINTLKDEYV